MSDELEPTLHATESGRSEAKLAVVVIGPEGAETFALPESGTLTVGRASGDDRLAIDDPLISRSHATIHIGETIEIEDLGSANGTLVQGHALESGTRREVLPGQVIDVGSSMLIIRHATASTPKKRLYSHGYLEIRLEEECERSTKEVKSPFALVRVDVSGAVGKTVIERSLTGVLRATDVVAAYAPNQYELLLVDTSRQRAARIARELTEALEGGGGRADVGIACFPEDGVTPEALISRAGEHLRGAGDEQAGGVIIEDPAMRDLYRVIDRVAQGTITLLLLGETGVGKEIVAEAIHRRSPRSRAPFMRLNCAALSEMLVESELFGYERGAFTGADRAKEGLLEVAHGGTIFLDEVGELPIATQAKLLRVIEQREVLRVGSVKPRSVDVRFVSATNRDLEQEVARGRFRQDLYYRLNGVALEIPPLRRRPGEIEPLARAFVEKVSREMGRSAQEISPEALELLKRYSWPGNVRELRNVMERAVLLAVGDRIDPVNLPLEKLSAAWSAPDENAARRGSQLTTLTREKIIEALEQNAGNQTRAAEALGVSRQTLSKWLERYDLPRPRKGG